MRLVPLPDAKLIVVFDFSCLAYRAFHSKAKNREAALVERILYHLAPLQGVDVSIIMALDSLFLNKTTILPHYKANRTRHEENPKEIFQWVLDSLPFYQAQTLGEEADDVICSLVKCHPEKNLMIVTGDSDLIHLMDRPNVVVVSEQTGQAWNENKHINANFLKLSQISAFKTLFGDTSDNVKPIWPRLRRKLFEEVIWIHSHDKAKFVEATMNVLKTSVGLNDQELETAKANLFSNYELVIPRFDLAIDLKAPNAEGCDPKHLLAIDPSLVFLSQFFKGAKASEPIYEK